MFVDSLTLQSSHADTATVLHIFPSSLGVTVSIDLVRVEMLLGPPPARGKEREVKRRTISQKKKSDILLKCPGANHQTVEL